MASRPEQEHAHDGYGGLDSRLVRLEEWRNSVAQTLDNLTAITSKLASAVEQLNLRLAGFRQCPAPGECLRLSERMGKVEERLNQSEQQRAVDGAALGAGGWLVRTLIVALLATLSAVVGRWLIP